MTPSYDGCLEICKAAVLCVDDLVIYPPIIRAITFALGAAIISSCTAKEPMAAACLKIDSVASARTHLDLPNGTIKQGPFKLQVDKNRKIQIAVLEADNQVDAPLLVRISHLKNNGCWSDASTIVVDGKKEFGIRSKTLLPVSLFAEDVDRRPGKEVVLLYSGYIDGTGDTEKFAAAILDLKKDTAVRLPLLERKFSGVPDAKTFRQRQKAFLPKK
jgi:hypothetical protein